MAAKAISLTALDAFCTGWRLGRLVSERKWYVEARLKGHVTWRHFRQCDRPEQALEAALEECVKLQQAGMLS